MLQLMLKCFSQTDTLNTYISFPFATQRLLIIRLIHCLIIFWLHSIKRAVVTNMHNKPKGDSECFISSALPQPICGSWNLNTIKPKEKQLARYHIRYHIQHQQLISKTNGMLLTASCSTVWKYPSYLQYGKQSSNVVWASWKLFHHSS